MKSTVIQQMLTDAERMHGECMEDAWRTVIHTPGPRQLKANRIPLDKPKRFNSFCDSYLTFQHQHHQKKKNYPILENQSIWHRRREDTDHSAFFRTESFIHFHLKWLHSTLTSKLLIYSFCEALKQFKYKCENIQHTTF